MIDCPRCARPVHGVAEIRGVRYCHTDKRRCYRDELAHLALGWGSGPHSLPERDTPHGTVGGRGIVARLLSRAGRP